MLSDPASASTSRTAMKALQSNTAPDGSSLLDALISALVEPVPFGADGDNERDVEFQENVVRLATTLPLSRRLLMCIQTASHVFSIVRW